MFFFYAFIAAIKRNKSSAVEARTQNDAARGRKDETGALLVGSQYYNS
jgi:hypothetical protein